jgi:cytidyltransferase-like protein
MSCSKKFIPFNTLHRVIQKKKREGLTIVQCHGTFDLIHPGHIIHFEEAKALGDILVVTITAEQHVNKGPGRPYFNDDLRVKSLSNLATIDHVSVVPYPAAKEAIQAVCPNVYCKGKEYENPAIDVTGNIHDDLKTVKEIGGKVAYLGSVIFSSSKILNQNFASFSESTNKLLQNLSSNFSLKKFKNIVDNFSSLRVLIIGDLILDKYSTVSVQGLTSKNRILSSRFISENIQAGGALAIFRHLREFTPHVKLLSLAGEEPWLKSLLEKYLKKEENWIFLDPSFTTIVKHRFVEPLSDGKELSKLFSVNYLDDEKASSKTNERISNKVAQYVKDFDLVLVADFGHGIMGDKLRQIVQEEAPFFALNCQTNSNNYGFNVINRQYQRADSFSLDQTEMSLACGKKEFDNLNELQKLSKQLNSKYGWFTRGGAETFGISPDETHCVCESLENTVVDTVGAGDAFCSTASLAAASGLPLELATLMGQISGALAVKIVGNKECVSKINFLKSAESLLKR